MSHYPEFYHSIPKTLAYVTNILQDACKNRHNPCHTMNIAYIHHNMPVCRTVVLRTCDNQLDYLQFNTDYRSPKIDAIKYNQHVAGHFYDNQSKIQLSIHTKAIIHYMDDVAKEAWEKTQILSRQCYLQETAPSYPIAKPDKKKQTMDILDETEKGYFNFCVIRLYIKKIDFLYLHSNANRRILFTKNTHNQFIGEWISP